MTTEEFQQKRESIPNSELIEQARLALSNLCKTDGQSFTMTVPPRIDDTDIVINELLRRYEAMLEEREDRRLDWKFENF